MQESDQSKQLERGDPVQVDCSSSKNISSISYQQSFNSKKLEVNSQLPEQRWCGLTSVQLSCTTIPDKAATFSGALEAHAGHVIATVTADQHGATSTVFELTGRAYALLLRRFLETKLRFGSTHSRPSSKLTSSAEVVIPALAQNLSCKAYATTDFCQRLVLQAELHWKAKQKQATQDAHTRTKQADRRPACRQNLLTVCQQDGAQPMSHAPCYPSSACDLPWTSQAVHYPTATFARKRRPTFWKDSAAKGMNGIDINKDTKEEPQAGMAPCDQFTLQLKRSPEGTSPPSWQIRWQKALSRKAQLRGQAGAAMGAANLLPSKWQLEAKHKLQRGAMLNVRVQREDKRPTQHQSRHRVQIEYKGRAKMIACTCTHEPTGLQVGLKVKARSGKGKFSSQDWYFSLSGTAHLNIRPDRNPMLKAEISFPC